MASDDRLDPFSEVLNLVAAPLAGTIRSVDQFRRGVDEFLRGVENFNRTMENLNETAERVNVLLAEVEQPLRAAIPQITRTVKAADEMMQVVSGPAMAVAPGLNRLADALSTPGLSQLPSQLSQFTDAIADISRRLGPLAQFAESAGGMFGGLRLPGMSAPKHAPAQPEPEPEIVVAHVSMRKAPASAAPKKRTAATSSANKRASQKTTSRKSASKKTAGRTSAARPVN
jgi:hypothetical protein